MKPLQTKLVISSFDRLVNWKTKSGFRTVLVRRSVKDTDMNLSQNTELL